MTNEEKQQRNNSDSKEQKEKQEISPQRDPRKTDPPKK